MFVVIPWRDCHAAIAALLPGQAFVLLPPYGMMEPGRPEREHCTRLPAVGRGRGRDDVVRVFCCRSHLVVARARHAVTLLSCDGLLLEARAAVQPHAPTG